MSNNISYFDNYRLTKSGKREFLKKNKSNSYFSKNFRNFRYFDEYNLI